MKASFSGSLRQRSLRLQWASFSLARLRSVTWFLTLFIACAPPSGPNTPAAAPSEPTEPMMMPMTVVDAGTPPVDAGAEVDAGVAVIDAGLPVIYPVPDWPMDTPESQGLDSADLATAGAAAASDSFCLLVIRHGVLVHEQYWNGGTPTSRHPSWSIAKSWTSTLVGIAIDRGELQGLDQSVADFIPEWRGTDRAAITIRELVSMTSGLRWSAFQDYVQMATFAQDHSAFAIEQPLMDAPGSKWTYDNAGVQVLERVFRAATGRTVEQYAQTHLWSPLGMTASWGADRAGNPTTYANVLASCRDQARLGYLYLHRGKWNGEQIVSESWIDQALTPSQPFNRAYGFLWWLNGEAPAQDAMMQPWPGRAMPYAPPDMFAARGFGNQFIDVIPSLDLVVVRFGKDPAGGGFDLGALIVDAQFGRHDEIFQPVLGAVRP